MKKISNNLLLLILNILIFMFFLGFIYFSYFTAKELLVVKYITPSDYSNKFYSWEVKQCNNPYSYEHRNFYSSEAKIKSMQTPEQKRKIEENNRKVISKCLNKLNDRSEKSRNADFKYNMIKYSTATLFFLVLFLLFAVQNIFLYRKK